MPNPSCDVGRAANSTRWLIWAGIVNLQINEVEVRTRPVGGQTEAEGKYLDLRIYKPGDRIDLLIKPDASVAVNHILGIDPSPSRKGG